MLLRDWLVGISRTSSQVEIKADFRVRGLHWWACDAIADGRPYTGLPQMSCPANRRKNDGPVLLPGPCQRSDGPVFLVNVGFLVQIGE